MITISSGHQLKESMFSHGAFKCLEIFSYERSPVKGKVLKWLGLHGNVQVNDDKFKLELAVKLGCFHHW